MKEIEEDQLLDRQLDSALPGVPVGGIQNDPAFNTISGKIHEAVEQFDSVNLDQREPNGLAFVCRDSRLDVTYLDNVLTGDFVDSKGGCHPIYVRFSAGRILYEKSRVHLYIWLDMHGVYYRVNEVNREHVKVLSEFFDFRFPAE